MSLQLSRKARLGKKPIKPIKLPSNRIHLKENKMCSVEGWGYTRTAGHPVDELQVVNVPIINQEECLRLWIQLPAKVICAGGYKTKKGFCQVCFLCVHTRYKMQTGQTPENE